jgi:hypothetical protein
MAASISAISVGVKSCIQSVRRTICGPVQAQALVMGSKGLMGPVGFVICSLRPSQGYGNPTALMLRLSKHERAR